MSLANFWQQSESRAPGDVINVPVQCIGLKIRSIAF
jgi:hypothetical protein